MTAMIDIVRRSVKGHLDSIAKQRRVVVRLEDDGLFRERLVQARILLRQKLSVLGIALGELQQLRNADGTLGEDGPAALQRPD